MIYDCFTFFNEFELLKIRLEELSPLVDKFVIVEADRTFTGLEKEFWFTNRCTEAGIEEFLPKIKLVQVSDMPDGPDPWKRESHQRNAIMRGLTDLKDDDTVIIGDADEIPSRYAVEAYSLMSNPDFWKGPYRLQMKMFYFYLNLAARRDWFYSIICRGIDLMNEKGPDGIRAKLVNPSQFIERAGWHFTYMGGSDKIVQKIRSFSHGVEEGSKRMADQFESGELDWSKVGGGWVDKQVPVDNTFPRYVQKYQGLLEEIGYLL